MKLGFVIYGSIDTLSGGYLYDRKLVEYLRAQGDSVEVISLPWRNYAAHLTDNFWLRFRSPGGCPWKFRQQAVRLQNFDVLIQDELNHPSLIGANTGKHPYPVISLVHHLRCSELRPKWQNDLYRVVEKKYLQSVDGFIFNSQTTCSVVNGLIGENKPSIVAYPPTDRFDSISKEEITERTNKEPFCILFLGNVIYRKGLHTLINALANVGQNNISSFRLDVAGSLITDTDYATSMQKQVVDSGLSSMVHFHGALDNDPLMEKLKQAHMLIVPSSYEGFGIVYLEGMAFGLPAIGTTAGAASEIIADGETGYLIAPDDSQTLATRIMSLANDRNLLVKMSINALRRYDSLPKWEQTAQRIREFLYVVASDFAKQSPSRT